MVKEIIAKKYLVCIVAGVLSALMFATIQTGGELGVLSIYLSAFPIAAVGFAFGLSVLMIAGVAGALLLNVISSFGMAFAFVLVDCIPVLIAVGLFLFGVDKEQKKIVSKSFNYGFILAVLCVFMSVIMVVVAQIMVANFDLPFLDAEQVMDNTSIKAVVHMLVEEVIKKTVVELPIEIEAVTKVLVPVVPAIMVVMWLFHIMIGLIVSIWSVDKLGIAIRKKPDYKDMVLPYWFVAAIVAAIGVGFTFGGNNGYLAQNTAIVLLMPFVLQGFTVVHMFAYKTKYPKTAMFFFYSFFVVGSYRVVLAIGILGLIENFIKLRHKKVVINLEE